VVLVRDDVGNPALVGVERCERVALVPRPLLLLRAHKGHIRDVVVAVQHLFLLLVFDLRFALFLCYIFIFSFCLSFSHDWPLATHTLSAGVNMPGHWIRVLLLME
jgi:hypothetical protein